MVEREYAEKLAALVGGKVVENKKNGVTLTGVSVPLDKKISSIFYVRDFIGNAKTPEWAAGYIRAESKKRMQSVPDIGYAEILQWNNAKGYLRARLQHRETEPEICRSAGEYGLDDLVIVPYLLLGDNESGIQIVTVSVSLLDAWKQSPKTVLDIAMENTAGDVEIRDLNGLLTELGVDIPEKEDDYPEMLAVSNARNWYWAIAAIFAAEELVKRFGTGYTLIPSSVHEMIAINRQSGKTMGEINKTVIDVNRNELAPEERLSDHAYEMW